MTDTTREMIRKFNLAFKRPVNNRVVPLTVTERELLGKLLLEETLEYCVKGLGLKVFVNVDPRLAANEQTTMVRLAEGVKYDPIESADGLGDVNVVIHFASHWHGFDLDAITREINDSNMSKLNDDGEPIINKTVGTGRFDIHGNEIESLIDPSKPAGKILKGPDFRKPDIASVLDLSQFNQETN